MMVSKCNESSKHSREFQNRIFNSFKIHKYSQSNAIDIVTSELIHRNFDTCQLIKLLHFNIIHTLLHSPYPSKRTNRTTEFYDTNTFE